ncbi:HSP20-like chaperone [Gloeophyllum trabeum ATCC 11539]|uniref:HSP20-like chaperone n=1 Tax=Gloeophyllum trabeum (strain ATCC 11539 / FP-39264 / Madison 617) TaxID=670483 RepID=S7QCG2_GLOTA|nr:HSP20-like chaperone [Gloeophyllum trabeum ATCC 11539]EPQ57068.1 HSP20-like chaperone [Gloeophyllum trabeum ATCC 11539]
MSLYFYEPLFSLSDFDRLFDEAFSARTQGSPAAGQLQRRGDASDNNNRVVRPRMDLHEDAERNVVTATFELPGLKKEDVQIDVQNNTLNISGETKQEQDRDENGYAIRERRYGKFYRALRLPAGVKPEDIKASMEHGVLTVTFPKTTPEQAPKKITIS